ncbi:MAG TPA: cyclopropane fatty acyl phospholipid synthase [Thermodesulfobacteriota bacterium]|nr:cyclopropane fatty acyl phospholipid synthase [Deltaproteobacteria bacterium]HNR12527.1 cyclopropane fatty acyl phospholipid synthase [Thermodesulfobacteriota bacterium]HNU71236.1 cyclopropane fatty acyl phospholipid synthase [Thermodesulfobacteriota bacterium]HOC39124.1 cyclopropane fatty acyl phospholipid synthase [Thermodesulfobacteriota bacterium]
MSRTNARSIIEELFDDAGITVNGSNPYDIHVHNNEFYPRVLSDGALGLGESYMEQWWECTAVDQFIDRVQRANLPFRLRKSWKIAWHYLKAKIFNLQSIQRAFQVGHKHYDIGNDLYQRMLGKTMAYTSAYWTTATTLDEAQEAKMDLVCRKIGLQPGMSVLELGCGFGSFARFAAEHYGVSVTGYTISQQQAEWGTGANKGLPVIINLDDYRKAQGAYDRVVSIGIMEHVGYKNYSTYMDLVARTLKPEGIAFIHTIGGNFSMTNTDPWTSKYIFPNGMLPSIAQLGKAMEKIFVMEDWHNFGPHYDKTLMAWHENFERAWPELARAYGERFYRMWRFYLLACAGGFRSRRLQLWQIVMTKLGREQPLCRLS